MISLLRPRVVFSPLLPALAAFLLAPGCTTPTPTATATRPTTTFDVRAYGATGNGHTLDTTAINQAIDAAAAAGGGTVVFPAGTYASYSIHLKSHVTLYLGSGSTLLAADPPAEGQPGGYDAPEPNEWAFYQDFGHTHWHNSLIWGENLEDIAILGPGRIFGRGLSRGNGRRALLPGEITPETRRAPTDVLGADGQPRVTETPAIKPGPFGYPSVRDTLPAGVGNKAIALKNCRNVIFRDFTIFHGGHFGILATGVDNWTCDNLKIDTNRDGIDFDCCQNVRVANCTVNSPYDDGICPKSSFGLGHLRPTENVTITNCQVSGYDEGTLLDGTRQRLAPHRNGPIGRIKCGTESNGGFRNITITNCVFDYCRGLALESVDGALMEDITVSNLTMRDIANAPIYVRLGTRLRGPDGPKVGTARRIRIDNVVAHNVANQAGILIAGDPAQAVEDLTLSNIFIDFAGGGTREQAARVVPEYEGNYRYPEPSALGSLPSWGLFARHVKGLDVHHVEFRTATADLRAVVYLEDVARIDFDHARLPHAADTPTFQLNGVTGLAIHNSPGLPETNRTEAIANEQL